MQKMTNKQKGVSALLPLVVITLMGLAGVGTVIASENSKPGDLLFPVKTTVNSILEPSDDNRGKSLKAQDNSNDVSNNSQPSPSPEMGDDSAGRGELKLQNNEPEIRGQEVEARGQEAEARGRIAEGENHPRGGNNSSNSGGTEDNSSRSSND